MREVSEKYPTRSIDCSSQQKVGEKQLVAFVVQLIIPILKVNDEDIVSCFIKEWVNSPLTWTCTPLWPLFPNCRRRGRRNSRRSCAKTLEWCNPHASCYRSHWRWPCNMESMCEEMGRGQNRNLGISWTQMGKSSIPALPCKRSMPEIELNRNNHLAHPRPHVKPRGEGDWVNDHLAVNKKSVLSPTRNPPQ